ncbi:hypothetical protein [Sphingomonas sp. MMS24-J13]|uniref:hypothetical protein n=1 Tax=Sphingomonas sp. MMS24-J13 TaxID=3238686 RepID=UPI00384C38F4
MNPPSSTASTAAEAMEPPIDSLQALRTRMDLARASQLTMLRFQLALHKSNRHVAMQALDDLLDLDAEIEGLAAAPAGVASGNGPLSAFIRHQKSAIATEKHGLAGGDARSIGRPAAVAPADEPADRDGPAERASAVDATELGDLEVAAPSPAPVHIDARQGSDQARGRRWLYGLAFATMFLLAGFASTVILWPAAFATLIDIPARIVAVASPGSG